MPLKAIFFDAGGTLVFADLERTLAPLHARGIRPSEEQLYAAERHAKRLLDRGRAEHHSVDAQYWEIYYEDLFTSLGLNHDSQLLTAVVIATRTGSNWARVRPGTRDVLERLRSRYRLGVISNSDGSVGRLLQKVGLFDCFECIVDSHHCGCEKPDSRIFHTAMAKLNVQAKESLFLGDVYSVDFVGAQSVGMRALLMDPAGAYRDAPHPRINSLAELEQQLQLSSF